MRQEIDDFTNNYIEVVPGYQFNQYDTIKRCHLYLNSKFRSNEYFHNRKKIFFNIVNYRRDTVSKAIDIDTKDIRLIPMNPESKMKTFIAEKEFLLWMKQNELGETLNQLADDLSSFGSIVLKVVAGKAENVDLRRFFLDQTVEKLQDSRFVTQELYMTQSELNAMRGKWDDDAIDQVLAKFGSIYSPRSYVNDGTEVPTGSTPYYKIYERYGDVPRYMLKQQPGMVDYDLDGDDNDLVRAMFVVAEPFATYKSKTSSTEYDNGEVLSVSLWDKEYPYEDCHYTKTRGRWLGLGPVEQLFEAQERVNELANQKRISMEISALHLFQTTDRSAPRNLMRNANSGDVMIVNTEITPIANEERNLPAFESENNTYEALADKLTFTYDAARGESLPSSTPATNAVLQNNNINSFFAKKRENFGLFLQRFLNKHILPKLLKDINKEHMFRFLGEPEEIARIDETISPYYTRKEVIARVLKGQTVTPEDIPVIEQQMLQEMRKQGPDRFIQVVKGWYDDVETEFDVVVTGEQKDMQVMAENMFNIMNTLAGNPALLDDPVMRSIFYRYAETIGVSSMEIDLAMQKREQMKSQMPQPMGALPEVPQENAVPTA